MPIPVWRLVLDGLASLVRTPPVGTGGTVSARYCYSVFMRHRAIAARHGLAKRPLNVIELGPGDSLGIGLMALLTGSERYTAIDAVRHASLETNLGVFDELITLLRNRTPIPYGGEYAAVYPELEQYDFPHQVLDEALLEESLAPDRLARIREQLSTGSLSDAIKYLAPLGEMSGIPTGSVDWIFSQAVMEHVDDPGSTYRECFRCLKPGAIMTHQVDFRCHDTAPEWNGHWKYPQWLWNLMRGRRPWFVNRMPHSVHHQLQKQAGFEMLVDVAQTQEQGLRRSQLAEGFRSLSDKDLSTAGAMFVSVRTSTK